MILINCDLSWRLGQSVWSLREINVLLAGGFEMGTGMIKKGDVVRIKKEWQDDGDDLIVFVACEDEDGGRVLIEAQVPLTFKPRQVVQVSMLEAE
jgi:hypothetical protein